MDGFKHYVRMDGAGIVVGGFSDAFEQPEKDAVCIDENAGRHFTLQLRNERGQFRYKYVDDAMVEREQAELDAEWNARPPAPETESQKITRLESEKAALAEQVATINRDFTDFVEFYFTNNPEPL